MADERHVELEAHRGESYLAPENTMAAFNLAWANDDDAAELDIHLTKDGQLIVCHDYDTLRTGGEKLVIKDHSAEELRKLDAGKFKGTQFAGQQLPLLSEVLASIPQGKRLFIEIKCGPEAVPELARLVKSSGKKNEQLVVISFHADALEAAKKRLPQLKMYYLSGFKQDKQTKKWTPTIDELIATAKRIGADGLDLAAKEPVDADAVKNVKAAGLEFYAWTVDEPPLAKKLIDYGVDGITTNRAAWLKKQTQRAGQ